MASSIHFDSPWLLCFALLAAIGVVLIVIRRRLPLPKITLALAGAGLLLLAIAAGAPLWPRPASSQVVVMVDLSPSTRGADFRNAGKLRDQIHRLLGSTPYQLIYFSDVNRPATLDTPLAEMPCEKTIFSLPAGGAAAIVLFSDARVDLPQALPPTYSIVDPQLEHPSDASIDRLEIRGKQLAVTVANSGSARRLTLRAAPPAATTTQSLPPAVGHQSNQQVVLKNLDTSADAASAEISPGDPWPENDSMAIRLSPPTASQRWWVGQSPPGGNWKHYSSADLPLDPATYLSPSLVVLNNVAASEISAAAQDRLMQYVRDLGGSILILGGDHSFAAGGYPGSTLEQISPLASSPPSPTMRWMILADASGSMSQPHDSPLWDKAAGAVVKLLPRLPPQDPVYVGQFSDVLRWWSSGKSARETAALALPPPDALPHGPTNLDQALREIAADTPDAMPTQLLVLSDCDTHIDRPEEIVAQFQKNKIHLHVLALASDGSGLPTIRNMVTATGGAILEQSDPAQWPQAVTQLMRQAMPQQLVTDPTSVNFIASAKAIGVAQAAPWDRAWLKKDAELLAEANVDGQAIAMAGQWRLGAGQATAVTFAPADQQINALADLLAQNPRDPRFTIVFDSGSQLRVRVDALDKSAGGKYLNGLDLHLQIAEEGDSPTAWRKLSVPQTGPGRYELSLPATRRPAIVTLLNADQTLDRVGVAGRYPPEFDAIGNDTRAMQELADRSGGQVIWPKDIKPIDFNWPRRNVPLSAFLAAGGALLIALGLIFWRLA